MNIHIGTPFGLIVLLGGIVLLVLFFFDFISVSLMGMSRNRSEDQVRSSGRTHFFRKGFLSAILIGIVMLVVIRIKFVSRDEVRVDEKFSYSANDSLREAMLDLSEAQVDIQKAVSEVTRAIPPIPPIPSLPPISEAGANSASQLIRATAARAAALATKPAPEAASIPVPPVSDEGPRKKLSELSAIRQMIRERFNRTAPPGEGPAGIAQAAESANGDVVVLELSDQMTKELMGESGRALLNSLNSDLPERIRQTFAVIPLTSPVDPVAPLNPVLANEALEAFANFIVSMADRSGHAVSDETSPSYTASVISTDSLSDQRMPEWVEKPSAGRIVVKTEPLLSGESDQQPLRKAINRALAEHLSAVSESMDPILREQTRFVRLELDSRTAERCIVQRFERLEELETGVEGPKPFRQVYALLEFPESVDKVAEQKIRQSLQNDRMAGLGVIVMCVWLSVCSAGCSIRLRNSGTGWLKLTAIPMMALVAAALMVFAAGLTIAFARGATPRPPWADNSPPMVIQMDGRG